MFISSCRLVASSCYTFISSCRLVISSCRLVISSCRLVTSSCDTLISPCCRVISSFQVFLSVSCCPSSQFCLRHSQSLLIVPVSTKAIAIDRLCCLSSPSFSALLSWIHSPACVELFVARSPGLSLVCFLSRI